jgi:hypothetical protein
MQFTLATVIIIHIHPLLLDGVCNPVRDVSFAGRGLQPRPRRFFSARLFFSLRGIGLPSELTA